MKEGDKELLNPFPLYDGMDCDAYNERAAIMEFDGCLEREDAEREAAKLVHIAHRIIMTSEDRSLEDLRRETVQRKVRYTARELVALDTSAPAQLWDGFFPKNDIVLFTGVQGKGKSTVVRELSLAISRKDDLFLTRALNVKYGKVIYIKGEGGVMHFARILKRYGSEMPEGFILIDGCRLSLPEIHSEVEAELKRGAVDLIVLDSLGNFFTGEQNSNSDAQNFLRQFSKYAEDCVILFIHHIGKSGHHESPDIKFVQGAGAFTQRARSVVMMVGNDSDNRRWLRLAKEDNVSEEFKKELLCVEFQNGSYSCDGSRWPIEKVAQFLRPVKAEDRNTVHVKKENARMMRESGDSIGQIAESLGVSKSTIHDWTKDILSDSNSVGKPKNETKRMKNGQIDMDTVSVRSAKSSVKQTNERQKSLYSPQRKVRNYKKTKPGKGT